MKGSKEAVNSFSCPIFTSVIVIHFYVLEAGSISIVPCTALAGPEGESSNEGVHAPCKQLSDVIIRKFWVFSLRLGDTLFLHGFVSLIIL